MIPSPLARAGALLALGCSLPAGLCADSVVVFNELQYNPLGTAEDGEWIELHNQMAVNMDLSDWKLANGVDFTFPVGTVIPGGGYLVVAKDPGNPALAGAGTVLGPYDGFLSNGGERVELRSSADRLMDQVDYGDAGEWPVAADGAGVTIAKRDPGLASGTNANWTASSQVGGTPGGLNFPEPGDLIRHTMVAANATWKFEDSGSAPAGSWTAVGFNDASWADGQALFGTEAGGGPAILTVTQHLVERFRAADIAGASNGQTLSTWTDTATGDGTAQNATAGGNPTFRTNATPSGEPVVRFDGDDEFRTSAAPGIGATSGFVYIAVVKATNPPSGGGVTTGGGPYLWDRDAAVGNPLVSLKPDGGRFGLQKRYDNGSGLGGPISATSISTTDYQIVAVRRNTSQNRFEMWVDGVMESTESDSGAALTPQPIVIGRHATNVSGGFDGDIAELLIYEDELTDLEFQAVGAYLESRYGLDTAFPGSAVNTSISPTAGTTYFRQEFTFSGDPARTVLRLDSTVADGAIFYLNGSEISRINLPGGAISHGTDALSDVTEPSATGFLPIPNTTLLNGSNVLAVSLHTASGNDTAIFAASLEGTESPPDPSSDAALVLNEVAGAGDAFFYVEIINPGPGPVSTNGYVLAIEGSSPADIPLPVANLQPGDLLQLSEAQLGQRPASGDKLFLRTPGGGGVADAREVTNRLRGLSAEYPGQWIFPDAATPGAVNSFNLESDIVINEICYNAPLVPATPGTPPTVNNVPLIAANSEWRYNAAGENFGASWATVAHPVGGFWQSGNDIIGFDGPEFTEPIATPVASPQSNIPYIVTYYFERDFNLTAQQAADLTTLDLTHLIDDGAVFYLNGVEIHRFNMPFGSISASTFAGPAGINVATYITDNVAVPPNTAVAGVNRLSVEVHQNSNSSGDIIFGLAVDAPLVIDPGTPSLPRRESDEQWIEIYNRGTSQVDLSDWDFGEGVRFDFPSPTLLDAGDYLVIAKDPAAVLAAHPGIEVVGPYSGSLSRSGETLTLRDAFNNPVDTVRYGDGGSWPSTPDGGGTTLELRDPDADNSLPDAWAASDELARTSWQTYTYRGVAKASVVGPDGQWKEFVFGMLEEAEVLIDDLTVTENPDGAATPFLSNGTFNSLSSWRALGNHRHVSIVPDPDGGGNVLYLRATGSTEHMHNHLETTLRNGEEVVNGTEYEISFRARLLTGTNLLHTRLYFNRLPMTHELQRPSIIGTPGAPNSTLEANIGPTSWGLTHSPVVPASGEAVTVSVNVSDPDGIGPLNLHYAVNGIWNPIPVVMAATGSGSRYEGVIPGQSSGLPVQFYVEAEDSLGATSLIPAGGSESRAMYEVEDGRAANTGIHNLRIVMDPDDVTWMHTDINVMSNDRIPCTVIYRESEIYYNCGVRIKGSERARNQPARVGFNIAFPKDNLFRGVHRTIAIDRSEGQHVGQGELIFDLMATSSRGIPGEFNDLCYVISPNPTHTSGAVLQMARFGSVFLESQFDNGDKGTVYEYELIYYPTTADGNGYKRPNPDGVVGTNVTAIGPGSQDNPEDYRWNFQIKNNQEVDDFSGIIALVKQFDESGVAFNNTVHDVLDVDQWLRSLAYSCATGAGDSFFDNSRHNGQFYTRPDGRTLYFTHDVDFAFEWNKSIFKNTELNELTVDPSRKRAYLGHLHDICSTVFNEAWMTPWHNHYNSLVPGSFTSDVSLSYINARSNYILGQINNQVAPIAFAITTNGGANFSTSSTPTTLTGDGWVNVREIRLAGSTTPLPTTWTTSTLNRWSISVPLSPGPNVINLEAVDHGGNVVGTDSITITSTAATNLPATDNLVVSELYYNPPGNDESTEYLELLNISSSVTLDLTGLSLTGVIFTFPAGVTLAPGARILLVANQPAFEAAFGTGHPVGGTYSGSLDNGGEAITVTLADGSPVQAFRYDDDAPWPVAADGDGYSLVLLDPFTAPDHNLAENWRASAYAGGSPGGSDTVDYATWKANFGNPSDFADPDGDQLRVIDEWFYGGSPAVAEAIGPRYRFLPDGVTMEVTVPRRAEAEDAAIQLQTSGDLLNWSMATGVTLIANERKVGSSPAVDLLTFRVTLSPAPQFFRFAFGP